MTPSLPAVSSMWAILADADKLAALATLARRARTESQLRDLPSVSFLYSDLPRLAASMIYSGAELFSSTLFPHVRCTPNDQKENLARVQSGLIEVLRRPVGFAAALKACPELGELLAIPAFGWQAYDDLFNSGCPRCFQGRSISRFTTSADRIDGVFVHDMGMRGYYAERLTLEMPAGAPRTFENELRAVDTLGRQALRLFQRCQDRGTKFYDQSPRHMRMQFHSNWPTAVPLEAEPSRPMTPERKTRPACAL